MKPRRSGNRAAFATTMALMLIALVGVAMAAATANLATSARQTRAMREEAQLRQLLLAGTEFLRSLPGEGEYRVTLPPPLKDEGAKLTVRIKGREVTVEATVGPRHIAQVLTLDAAGKVSAVRVLD
jgi:hypothetical protein